MTNPSRFSADCCYWNLLSFQVRSLGWQPACVPSASVHSLLWLVWLHHRPQPGQLPAELLCSVGPAAWPGEHDNIRGEERCECQSVSCCIVTGDTQSDICIKWRWLGIETWHERLIDTQGFRVHDRLTDWRWLGNTFSIVWQPWVK